MRVRYKEGNDEEPHLTKGKIYIVISNEFENSSEKSGEYIRYILENDMGDILPYEAKMFEVESPKLSSTWIFHKRKENNYTMIPQDIAYNSFWEDFYNGNRLAVSKLADVRGKIYIEELSDSEIVEIIEEAEGLKTDLILNALTEKKDNRFIKEVIEWCEKLLEKNKDESHLISGFKYLSNFKVKQVEEFFIEFLSATLINNRELIDVVNRYFDV